MEWPLLLHYVFFFSRKLSVQIDSLGSLFPSANYDDLFFLGETKEPQVKRVSSVAAFAAIPGICEALRSCRS